MSHCHCSHLNLTGTAKHCKSRCTLTPSALTEINSAPKSITTQDLGSGKKTKINLKAWHTAAKAGNLAGSWGKLLTHAAHERHQQSVPPHQTGRSQLRCMSDRCASVRATAEGGTLLASPRGSSYSLAFPLSIPSQPSQTSPIRFSSSTQWVTGSTTWWMFT